MPNPRKSLPRYLKHSSGKARIVWTDAAGTRREKVLPGAYDSPESRQAFARLQLELAVSPAVAVPLTLNTGPTVAEVLAPYLRHAITYHGDGSELEAIKVTVKAVRELYGMTSAADFGPKALAAVRESFVRRGWSRQYTNRQTNRIARAFKWAAGEELIPITLHTALKALAPLRAGKTAAPETKLRTPANPADVEKVLPFLPPHVRPLVLLIRLTGMRPSEACRMRLADIDRSAAVWVYTLAEHKTAYRGKSRTVHIGEAAQAVVTEYLGGREVRDDDPLFSPRRQLVERYAEARAARKTKVQPSQVSRSKAKPLKVPGDWFTPAALCRAVAVACEKAGVKPWSPYQLRHLRGAELREKFSLEHVRAALGHSHASMSAHYSSGADAALAGEVARKVG